MTASRARLAWLVLFAGAWLGCEAEPDDAGAKADAGVVPGHSSGTQIDLLLMVDNSNTMKEEQAKLRDQIPELVRGLLEGVDIDGDGTIDYAGATDVNIGVVSSDMGLPGVPIVDGCLGLGDNGELIRAPRVATPSCSDLGPIDPPFLHYRDGHGDVTQIASDLACIATLGTDGCGFEMQLESALKALWPGHDRSLAFVTDPSSGFGEYGQAGPGFANGGFVRDHPADLSLIAIVLLTDEDDCSSSHMSHFVPNAAPEQGLNTRCYHESKRSEPNNLFDVERYIRSFKRLRPGNEDLVVFGAIAGVPPALVSKDAIDAIDHDDADSIDAFYEGILDDPKMQYALDDRDTKEPGDDRFVESCSDDDGVATAYPPRRIVEVARGFGQSGFVSSICDDDFSTARDLLIKRIAAALAPYRNRARPEDAR
jgi:hypothetical protein